MTDKVFVPEVRNEARRFYRDFVIWAWAYISLLEKRLAEQKRDKEQ